MTAEKKQPGAVRRVVTGHDAAGRSVIAQDGLSPFVLRTTATGPVVTDLWKTFGSPADNTGNAEPCSTVTLAPPSGGSGCTSLPSPSIAVRSSCVRSAEPGAGARQPAQASAAQSSNNWRKRRRGEQPAKDMGSAWMVVGYWSEMRNE